MFKKRYAEYTKYPRIFTKSYWGGDETVGLPDPELLSNRNSFVEEFKIEKYIESGYPTRGDAIFDHCELYKGKAGLVYVISPYLPEDDIEGKRAEARGFMKYKKLYAQNATTYIQLFADKREFNRYKKINLQNFLKKVEHTLPHHVLNLRIP